MFQAVKAYAAAGLPHGTVYEDCQGNCHTWRGGSPAWRNNNPGNLRPSAHHVGQIGTAWGFAVFADEASGAAAMQALLKRPLYQKLTLSQAIAQYAPPCDNNPTPAYLAFVVKNSGLAETTAMASLSAAQLASLTAAMSQFEGAVAGKIETEVNTAVAAA